MSDITKNHLSNPSFLSGLKELIVPLFFFGLFDGIFVTSGTILLNDRIISFSDTFVISLYMILLYTILISIVGTVIFSGIYILFKLFNPSLIIKKPLIQYVFLSIFFIFLFLQFFNKFISKYSYYSVFSFADTYWKMAILCGSATAIIAILSYILAKFAVTVYLYIIKSICTKLNLKIIITTIILLYTLSFILPAFYNRSKIKIKSEDIITAKVKVGNYSANNKIFVIGLDGATWNIIDPMIKKGELKNIKKLIDNGVRGNLKTSVPTESSILWTSIATGKIPEKHGIKSFILISFYGVSKLLSHVSQEGIFGKLQYLEFTGLTSVNPVNTAYRKTSALWNIISKYRGKSIIVNWFSSYPAEKINGYFVSDKFIRSVKYEKKPEIDKPCKYYRYLVYPEYLCEVLSENVESYISPEITERKYVSVFEKYIYEMENINFNISKHLLSKTKDINLFALYFRGTDDLEHLYWKYTDKKHFPWVTDSKREKYGKVIYNYYIQVDKYIGSILKKTDENTTILIISDHGHEPIFNFFDSDIAGQSGDHTLGPDGIFIASGKNISGNFKSKKPTIYDITPTILYLSGLPIGKDMDGKILTDIIDKNLLSKYPPKTIETYDIDYNPADVFRKEDRNLMKDKIMMEKLKALGYIN